MDYIAMKQFVEQANRLVEQAREDPQFFHELVFNTDNVLSGLDYLDRESKAELEAISPEEVIAAMISGQLMRPCGRTCMEWETCRRSVIV
jgi:hypothetical protein